MDYRVEFLRREAEVKPTIVQSITISAAHLHDAILKGVDALADLPHAKRAEYFRVWENEAGNRRI
jgi:hypothetical protein